MAHTYFNYSGKLMRRLLAFVFLFALCATPVAAQLVVNAGVSAATLLAALAGQGLTVSNVNLNCAANAYGTFSNGNTTNMGISNGILLTTGSATGAIGPNNSGSNGTCNGTSGSDAQLLAIEPQANEDLCVLEFDIVPQCSTLTISFVFGSEEYPEFVNSSFNDAFGFFISGPGPACQAGYYNNTNVATLPNNITPVSIDNVNATTNSAYYVNNAAGTTIQYDAFTTILTRNISLCPCQTYHFKLAIADAGDCYYDSGVFVDFLSCSNALTLNTSSTNSGCSGCTGTMSVTTTGGVGPFSYSWAPGGQTTNSVSGVCPGTYTVTVTDALSCSPSSTATVTVGSTGSAITTSGAQTNILCNGQCTGSATVTVLTGTGPFTYAWAPSGGTGTSASALCAGTYTCTVTGSGGCTTTRTFTITQPTALSTTGAQTNVVCNGQCNGSATVTASGGTGAYTYAWTPSGGTGASATALCAGTYTCTVTDANGCTTTRTFSITQPPAITTSGAQTNVLCNGQCTGSATVTVLTGTGPFTYAWAPSGGTGASASALCSGTYTCTVTGAGGCTATRTFNITQPTALSTTGAQTNVVCNGQCNGSATVTASGGTGAYTYAWTPSGGTGASATALCAGTYTCTVTDANGCTTTRTFSITQPPAITTSGAQTNVLCNGQCTGSATVTVLTGTGPFTYAWAPSGGTGTSASALCPGTYTCTVTGAGGCTTTRTFNITQPTALSTTGGQTNVVCNGQCNGSATVTASGGTGAYTYAWTPSGGTGASATALCAGTYTCTVTDANGCTTTRTFSITQPPAITTSGAQTNVLCNGQCTGSATVTVLTGTGPFTYAWAPSGGTGASASALCSGTYTCTVTGLGGCTATQTFNITQPTALSTTGGQTNVVCNGQCNGSATVTASGGTGAYTYAWTPSGGTGASATALCAGTYTCTVTDANGCTTTRTFSITQPPAITTSGAQTNVLCNGQCTGSATVTVLTGTGPFTYAWAPSGGTGASASALCSGTYTCTVTGAGGCTATRTFNITQPSAVSASAATTPATCGGSNGSATVTPTGGTGGYTYSWAPAGGTGATASGLPAGAYTVTVTDANGCTTTTVANITTTGGITASIVSTTNVLCFGGTTGSSTASGSGGTGPYTYSWAPSGGTGATTTGVGAGTYTVTVTDANNCIATATTTITQPPQLTASASSSPVLCNGGSTGSATVTASGGTGAYTYAWTPSGGTGTTASGLNATGYTVTVTDANGCTTTATTSVTQPTAVSANISATTNISCNGGNNGSATVTASGGTGAYTYAWAPSGGTSATASSLTVGAYTVTVTDANGCITTAIANITQPAAVSGTTSSTQATCGASNGTATVVASGGTGAYTYSWAPTGGSAATANGLPSGNYTVTITDANGCTGTATVNVPNAGGPTASISGSTNVSCFGGNNGTATVTASGGTGPYTYAWNPTGGSGSTGTGMIAGSYTVTVTDANGCTNTATVAITEPPVLSATATATAVVCFGGSTGSASVTASGGTGAYTYAWSPSGGTGSSAGSLPASGYTVTVTDANGCTTTASVNVTQPTALAAVISASTNVSCNAGNNGAATVTASGGTGAYTYAWSPSGGSAATASSLTANGYTVTVTDANGCTATASVNITQPAAITGVTSSTLATCGASNGTASVVASGGTGAYTYSWAPAGGTGATTTGVPAGNYTVTITDANLCTATATVAVTNASGPSATLSSFTDVTCFGANDGTATVTTVGGSNPINYAWTPSGGTNAGATNLGPGTYTCTVTDANGCSATATATITEPPQLVITSSSQVDVLCFGNNTGSATVTASGGNGAYTYTWTPSGGTGASASNLTAGNYTVTISDANSCSVTQTFAITEPPQLTVASAGFDATCFGACNGQVVVIPNGGVQPYAFAWNTGCSSPSCNSMCAGTYSITVTDANGCTASGTATVNDPPQLQASTTVVDAHCNQADGSATVTGTGGTGAYTYSWSSGGTGATENNLAANTYNVTVTDANGCTVSATATVGNLNGVNVSVTSTTNATCFGSCNGQATISATGGNSPYVISWPSGGSGTTETNLCAGTYTVTVTDANNCPSTATVTVTEPPQLLVTANAPPTICIGQNVTLTTTTTGGTAPYNEVWTPSGPNVSPTTTTTYTVNVTDANGCTATAQTVTVTVNPPLNVQASPGTSICPGANTQLSAVGNGGDGNLTYTWTPAPGTGNPVTVSPSTTTTYTVTVTDGCGTPSATSTVTVTVLTPPAVTFSTDVQSGCAPLCVSFTNTTAGAVTCAWDFGDGGTDNTTCTPVYCYNTPGIYTVILTVSDGNGCVSTLTMPNYINVSPIPVAEFAAGPQPTTILNPTISFTDQSVGAVSWSWNFGDLLGSSSILQNPSFTYPDTGCYDVTLTITNADGCTADTTHEVCIGGDFVIYAPNAFTPNDDGKNDLFKPVGVGIDEANFEMWIFDRWGNLIFYTDNFYKGWDGHANQGEEVAQIDTYVWKIKCKDILGYKHSYIGKVSLIK